MGLKHVKKINRVLYQEIKKGIADELNNFIMHKWNLSNPKSIGTVSHLLAWKMLGHIDNNYDRFYFEDESWDGEGENPYKHE